MIVNKEKRKKVLEEISDIFDKYKLKSMEVIMLGESIKMMSIMRMITFEVQQQLTEGNKDE